MKLLREGDIGLIQGLYALCPYIAGSWPRDDLPSTIENNGILRPAQPRVRWAMGLRRSRRVGLAAGVIGGCDRSENECDPLRRGHRLLSAVARLRRAGALSSGDGHDPRHRGLPNCLPRRIERPAESKQRTAATLTGTGADGDRDEAVRRGAQGDFHRHLASIQGLYALCGRGLVLYIDRLVLDGQAAASRPVKTRDQRGRVIERWYYIDIWPIDDCQLRTTASC